MALPHRSRKSKSPDPLFAATVGYVRSSGILSLDAYCKGKRLGAWPCYHSGTVRLADMTDETALSSIERRLVVYAVRSNRRRYTAVRA